MPDIFGPFFFSQILDYKGNTTLFYCFFQATTIVAVGFCSHLAVVGVNGVTSRQCSKSLGQSVQSFDLAIRAAARITATYAARKVHAWRVVAGSGTTDGDRWTFNRQMLQTLPRFNAAHGASKEFQVQPKQECKMHDMGERDSSLLSLLSSEKAVCRPPVVLNSNLDPQAGN